MTRWMPCREFVEFLDDYLAGRLSGEALVEFNHHLAGCPACVTYMQTYQQSVRLGHGALAGDADAEPMPEGLVQAILAARAKRP